MFDPADRLLGLKIYLFVGCWLVALALCALNRDNCRIHIGLLLYILLFVLVPTLSIAWYWFVDGNEEFAGFQLLKGYLLISLSALLFIHRIDLLPHLSAVLTVLALIIIGVAIALAIEPSLAAPLYLFGVSSGVLFLDSRDYGSGVVLSQIYFVTSPMLAISIAYYYHQARGAVRSREKLVCYMLAMISIVAMPIAGTRNNIAVALLLPLTLFVVYSKRRLLSAAVSGTFLLVLVIIFLDQAAAFLDPSEFSNNIKLALLDDYVHILSEPLVLLFGHGLGAYDYWAARDYYFYTSELTYFELIRSFGIFGALTMLGLLLFPFVYTSFVKRSFDQRHIILGYAFYLVMCASNPNLFSSMGVLILSIILANIFLYERSTQQTRMTRYGEVF